jgi:hypothetical protein
MYLSKSEFFVLSRLLKTWETATTMDSPPIWGSSLMATAEHVFFNFGLEHVGPPDGWMHVERLAAPGDTVWKTVEGHTPDFEPHESMDFVIPGVPSLSMGVSPSSPGRLFVERTDGEVIAWSIERPSCGLYLEIMRWLRPWAAVSPHLWLTMHEGSWPAVVEEWRTLPDFVQIDPHEPFDDDCPDGVLDAAVQAAQADGCEDAYRLGGLSALVDTQMASLAEAAQQGDALLRNDSYDGYPPQFNLRALLADAEQVLTSDAVREICRADDGAVGFYNSARRELTVVDSDIGGDHSIYYAIQQAYHRTVQATTYLYGTFRGK